MSTNQRWHLKLAAKTINLGGIVAHPSEAVFGLGCDPENEKAVAKLLQMKKRDFSKGLILVAASFEQIEPYIETVSADTMEVVKSSWPGPYTWLFPASKRTPWFITGSHRTVAVRVTKHPGLAELCRYCGYAIVSTSANPTGQPPAKTKLLVRKYFSKDLDLVLPGKLGDNPRPTSIKDARSGKTIRN